MKKLLVSLGVLGVVATSCKKDDDGGNTCQTCAAFDIEINGQTVTTPAIEVCEGDNGNAVVDGTDSGQNYVDYIEAYELFTDCN